MSATTTTRPFTFTPIQTILLTLATLVTLLPTGADARPLGLHISGGILGFIVLGLDLVAVFEVVNSSRGIGAKLGWTLLIFLFPVLGLVIYFFFGRHASGYQAIEEGA